MTEAEITKFIEDVVKIEERKRWAGVTSDDDPLPFAFFLGPKGICIAAIDGRFMHDSASKDMLAKQFAKTAAKFDAIACALSFSVWMSKGNERNSEGGIAGLPGTKEAALINEIRHDRCTIHFADIQRIQGCPPHLGPWQTMSTTDELARAEGRFVACQEILKRNYSKYVN